MTGQHLLTLVYAFPQAETIKAELEDERRKVPSCQILLPSCVSAGFIRCAVTVNQDMKQQADCITLLLFFFSSTLGLTPLCFNPCPDR